ncbi:MAG: ATP-binding cassette domain-containing protein [Pseudomonadota bacterium]
MTVIEVEDLSVFAGATRLLGPVSFRIARGGVLVVMGETGAGKSLIAQAILGTLPGALSFRGRIAINGQRVDTLPAADRARLWGRDLASLPQEPWRALDPLMAAARQVSETHRHVGGLPVAEAAAATARDFARLGLDPGERRLPGALSGGMAQRVAFAAATAGGAPILLADEPTKGLDHDRQARVIGLLAEVARAGGTLMAITHDAQVAEALGGTLVVLRNGRVVEQGATAQVLQAPQDPYTKALLAADPSAWPVLPAAEPGDLMLRAQGLAVSRGGPRLFAGIDLAIHAGARLAITGPSGVGKSTLLDALLGLIPPDEGRVERAGLLGRHAIQKLYQDPPAAFPPFGRLETSFRDVARRHAAAWETVLGYLEDLTLSPTLLQRRPDAVSGGELQRLSLARALIVGPRVLLADEPTSRLDPITQKTTLDLLHKVSLETGIAVVLVTHSAAIAERWADEVLHLTPGHEKAEKAIG